jgi:hypothetical protein
MGGQADEQIMATAAQQNRILVSADADFGELLANAPVLAPSVILLRQLSGLSESARSTATGERNSARASATVPGGNFVERHHCCGIVRSRQNRTERFERPRIAVLG